MLSTNTSSSDNADHTDNKKPQQREQNLPVIIAGAGPCGLTAALTLQKYQIPFVVYERASREKLCSNAGSGIDMAPSAVNILEHKLGVDMNQAMQEYQNMVVFDMSGKHVVSYKFHDMKITSTRNFGFANQAQLQQSILDTLLAMNMGSRSNCGEKQNDDNADTNAENNFLKCGIAVTGYQNESDHVLVQLSNGSTIKGLALLGCDGIHSAVRKHMHQNVNDSLSYIGQECWWGKATVVEGSELDHELKQMEKELSLSQNEDDDGNKSVSIAMIGTPKLPGGFFSCPVSPYTHAWVYFVKNKTAPPEANKSNDDLVRRGGSILTPEQKQQELMSAIQQRSKLLQLIISETPPDGITKAGLFDRSNSLHLPFVDGRVALLGDAAHPQSPMMGQGANMGIVDGYVVATRLAAAAAAAAATSVDRNDVDDGVTRALAKYDTRIRRWGINRTIKEARVSGNVVASRNRFKCWLAKAVVKYTPKFVLVLTLKQADKSNQDFIKRMEADIKKIGSIQ